MTEPADLGEAIAQRFAASDDAARTALAEQLRDFEPDPHLEQIDQRVTAMRAAGETSPLGEIGTRLLAYRNRKAQAAAFQTTGLLPDGTTPPDTAA